MNPEFDLDNAATTALHDAVLSETLPLLQGGFGNHSSPHAHGVDAGRAVKRARERLARLLDVPPRGITFTSGGTESGNLALKGAFASPRLKGERILVSAIEHPAVMEVCVVGVPNEQWGEVPKAFIVQNAGASVSGDEIIEFCRDRIAHFKAPKHVEFGELPKTATGKIQKFILREKEWAGHERRIN